MDTPQAQAHTPPRDKPEPAGSMPEASPISKALLPAGLALTGLACMMGLPRFREDLQGWGFFIAASVFATLFLATLEVSRRQGRRFTANLAGVLGVVLLSAVFWSLDQQLRTVAEFSTPALLAEGLTWLACLVLLWFYRLPALVGLLSIGLNVMAWSMLGRMTRDSASALWVSVATFFPLWMGMLHLAVATGLERLQPKWRAHSTWLHLVGLMLLQTGMLLMVQRQWLPLWGLMVVQAMLLAGALWLNRLGLVALLLVVTSLEVFLILGPVALGTPMGWDLVLGALGTSVLMWYGLWLVFQRRAAKPAWSKPTTSGATTSAETGYGNPPQP